MTITNVSAGIFSLILFHFKYVNELKGENQTIDEVEVYNSPTSTKSSYSVVVITLDFESNNPRFKS